MINSWTLARRRWAAFISFATPALIILYERVNFRDKSVLTLFKKFCLGCKNREILGFTQKWRILYICCGVYSAHYQISFKAFFCHWRVDHFQRTIPSVPSLHQKDLLKSITFPVTQVGVGDVQWIAAHTQCHIAVIQVGMKKLHWGTHVQRPSDPSWCDDWFGTLFLQHSSPMLYPSAMVY